MNPFRRNDDEPDDEFEDELEDEPENTEPTTGNHNSGVINYGSAGDIQNQPNARNSRQSMVTASAPETADRWARTMNQLADALAAERNKVTDPGTCEALLGVLRDQQVAQEPDRSAAGAMLNKLRTFCGDANNVLTVISTALGLLGLAAG
ncbi:hypothetical protein CW362_36705 [Streptomyces populi]|uniref:Uncharacterized protein n=1 Tax=Streptomyces populi TaxID=2058924 RepID=A0A2I0SDW1_9ACTN|nr:hypothetical protein [Streptomyces populi]PKT68123.1 hypothetical protein CW362_36705 [Streptomyces populi]